MKIAIFSWESLHSIAIGGVAAHVTELACALQRQGNEVHLFTRLGRPDQPWYEVIYGVHYHRCPYDSHHNFISEMQNMCSSFVQAFHAAEQVGGPFDVIHAHDWLAAKAMIWIRNDKGRKSIFTIHSTEYGRCGNNFWGGNSEGIRHIEWEGAFHANKVICVSRSLQSETEWIYGVPSDKINVVYNGVNNWLYDGWVDTMAVKRMYGIEPYDPMILFAGRMAYQKGPDILVESIPKVLHGRPNVKFVFVGDGDMRPFVESRARDLGVSHATRFLGHMSGWKLRDLFKACDGVVVPSRNEPFGIVILEGWSASKPVVATDKGGPAEIISHDVTGFTVYDNPDSIGWGISHLCDDFDHARWMGKNGRMATNTIFSWDTIAAQTAQVYSA